jgi:hypothetical protein
VAVVDDRDALHAVLAALETNRPVRPAAVLHGRRDRPAAASALGVLQRQARARQSAPG